MFNLFVLMLTAVLLTACGGSSTPGSNPDDPNLANITCESTDVDVFCVTVDDVPEVLFFEQPDPDSPFLVDPAISGRFNTGTGQSLLEVRFNIEPGIFIKAFSLVVDSNTPGTFMLDGIDTLATYTLAEDLAWTYIDGFSSGFVEITEYGAVGEYIRGTYSVNLCDFGSAFTAMSDCSNSEYLTTISGNFNILREDDI